MFLLKLTILRCPSESRICLDRLLQWPVYEPPVDSVKRMNKEGLRTQSEHYTTLRENFNPG